MDTCTQACGSVIILHVHLYAHLFHTCTDVSMPHYRLVIVQELCESQGGRPGLSVLMSLLVSVDVKLY